MHNSNISVATPDTSAASPAANTPGSNENSSSALDQAMAATLASIEIPDPVKGKMVDLLAKERTKRNRILFQKKSKSRPQQFLVPNPLKLFTKTRKKRWKLLKSCCESKMFRQIPIGTIASN